MFNGFANEWRITRQAVWATNWQLRKPINIVVSLSLHCFTKEADPSLRVQAG